MADINLLSDDESKKKAGPAKAAKSPSEDETALHIPEPEKEAPSAPPKTAAGLLNSLKGLVAGKDETPATIFNQKIEAVPTPAAPKAVPKPAVPAVTASPKLPPPAPPPPKPSPPLANPPNGKDEEKGGVLRVSLLAAGATAGLTDLAVRERMRAFLLIVVLALVVDGLIYGGLRYWRSQVVKRNETLARTVGDLDGLIGEAEAKVKPAREFQQLARLAERALDNHLHWTRFLELLEDRALTDVQFGAITISETGAASFEVIARDYSTLGKQILSFRSDPRVKAAIISTASADFAENNLLRGARAAMSLTFDPAVFRLPKEGAAAP